ncbi:ABC transporter permease [Lactovum odontotermitis]
MKLLNKKNRVLLKEFIKTDFKLRYQQSVIGYLWSILYPLMYFAVLYLVFVQFLQFGAGTPHWPVAMLLGLVIWTFFDEATHRSLYTVVGHGGLLRKIDFEKPVLIFSEIAGAAINLGINLCVVLIFMIINGVRIDWHIIFVIPLAFQLLLITAGISFVVATLYVSFRDIEPIWNVLLQVGMYFTPIIYPISLLRGKSELVAKIDMLNPMAQIISDLRWAIIGPQVGPVNIGGTMVNAPSYPPAFQFILNPAIASIPYVFSVLIFILGYTIFTRHADNFAEVL